MSRSLWMSQPDATLLAQCEVDTYRASGPGGQKRNKTSSAVRLRHNPSGLIVIAEESRSQHENKAKALKRLRRTLALELREPVTPQSLELWTHSHIATPKQDAFWPMAAVTLDALVAAEAQVSAAASLLGSSTATLIDILQREPKLWQAANQLRIAAGYKLLKA